MKKRIAATVLCMVMVAVQLVGCGKVSSEDFEGTYVGTKGSKLLLNSDGTAVYSEDDRTGTGVGTWIYEDGHLSIHVSNLEYEVYADIDKDATEVSSLTLDADSSRWHAEEFSKIK